VFPEGVILESTVHMLTYTSTSQQLISALYWKVKVCP